MKVILNLLQCHHDYTGTGRYVRNICRELAQIAPSTEFVQLVAVDNAETYAVNAPNFSQVHLPLRITKRIQRIAFEQSILPILGLRFRRSDTVLWSPNDVPIIGWPGRQAVTVHDLRRALLPEQFGLVERTYYQTMMRLAIRCSSRILTVSERSRQDIHSYYGVPLDHIHVTYNAVDPELRREQDESRIADVLAKHRLRKPFVLFVGQQMRIKGPLLLVEALAQLRTSRPELTLALVGKSGNATSLIETTAQTFGLGESLRRLPWVRDDELRCLYSAAEVMAFPTRYEGFGIPVLEAMQCGTPVITTRESCLPEVAGDAAYYLDEINVSALTAALTTVLGDADLRHNMVARGLVNAGRFTWKASAQNVLEALTAAAN